MKTAISIPDDIFASAGRLANELGVSRSELDATAVAEFVGRHRASDVTARLSWLTSDGGSVGEIRLSSRRAFACSIARCGRSVSPR